MLADPIVEELILAAPTAELAMKQYALGKEGETMTVPNRPNELLYRTVYEYGCIRICPPLKVANRLTLVRDYWRYLWMSRAERTQHRAMRKLLSNLLANAPTDKVGAESWTMTPEQTRGAMDALQSYVEAAKAKAGKE